MKRLSSFVLVTVLLLSIPVYAEEPVRDEASFIEKETGDTIMLREINVSENEIRRGSFSSSVYAVRVYRNGTLEETLFIDYLNDILKHVYPNGSFCTENISSIVKISFIPPSSEHFSENGFSDSGLMMRSIDYVGDEPFELSANGDQLQLPGVGAFAGFQMMGYRGGYYYAPDLFGYLQRMNYGVDGIYYSHRFDFSLGTKIGTAASLVVAFYFSSSVGGLVLSVATALLGYVIDQVIYEWSAEFEVRTYKWLYRVRLNSHTGPIIYTNYRTKDYWKCYNPATGAVSFQYRGSQYDWGFLLSNNDMIQYAIDSYLLGEDS